MTPQFAWEYPRREAGGVRTDATRRDETDATRRDETSREARRGDILDDGTFRAVRVHARAVGRRTGGWAGEG